MKVESILSSNLLQKNFSLKCTFIQCNKILLTKEHKTVNLYET